MGQAVRRSAKCATCTAPHRAVELQGVNVGDARGAEELGALDVGVRAVRVEAHGGDGLRLHVQHGLLVRAQARAPQTSLAMEERREREGEGGAERQFGCHSGG
jgi:hypothetical protein